MASHVFHYMPARACKLGCIVLALQHQVHPAAQTTEGLAVGPPALSPLNAVQLRLPADHGQIEVGIDPSRPQRSQAK